MARWAVAVATDDVAAMHEAATSFVATDPAPELGVFPFGPILAESLVRQDRHAEADEELKAYESRAQVSGRRSALMTAARVRGQLEAERMHRAAALAAFDEGLVHSRGLGMRFEQARLQESYGAALLRWGEHEQASVHLEEARNAFSAVGAAGRLAGIEKLMGSVPGSKRRDSHIRLTATEAIVARLVASGEPNKRVAQNLMVSRKAVEHHLTNIYSKLGVTSRTQLAAGYSRLVAEIGQSDSTE
jgi:DNA-binding CsgD family transcriptional regulator